ncbi:MAG: hypothetical protein GF330_01875 [Candidatus Eisenbacteria bacterium]|nr:hypothetical protein [Candidatus Eisenbacteria bacterium]
MVLDESRSIGLLTLALLLLALFLFGSLTVEVTTEAVRLWFGPGLVRRSFRLEQIRAVRAVRNKWYYGWGIRIFPGGVLYNVSGLDAVELEMRDGRRYRIGTSHPDELVRAIAAVTDLRGAAQGA